MNELVSYLIKTYDAKAVILTGSRAIGDNKEDGDYDIFILSNTKKKQELYFKFKRNPKFRNIDLDLYIKPLNTIFNYEEYGLKLMYSKILYDPLGLAKRLLKDAKRFYDKGPKMWSKNHALSRIDKSERYIKKIKSCHKSKLYGELMMRISWHYTENIINWWFGIRNLWPMRPQQAFNYIKEYDAAFYSALLKIYSETNYATKIKGFEDAHRLLFNSKEFKRIVR